MKRCEDIRGAEDLQIEAAWALWAGLKPGWPRVAFDRKENVL